MDLADGAMTPTATGDPPSPPARTVLVVNTGSSSLKVRVLDPSDQVVAGTEVDRWDGTDTTPIDAVLADAPPVEAVGHRVVHGGTDLRGPTVIDGGVMDRIDDLTALAPLHQPRALAAIRATGTLLPSVPAVACFDTAYHADLPPVAATLALPAEWRRRWPLRRFGFHGLSHAYAARRAAELLGTDPAELRVVTCHLGAGSSLGASRAGRSIDTTMGFTPLDGLVMQTRSGSVDPGLVLWLLTEAGLTPEAVRDGLEHHAGLAGLTGGTGDMRDVLAQRRAGDDRATLAFDVYVAHVAAGVAAMVTSLGGVDAVVFTGGVGEHSAEVRQATADRLAHLGVALDPAANHATSGIDAEVTAAGAAVATLVVAAREDLEIARQTRHALHPARPPR